MDKRGIDANRQKSIFALDNLTLHKRVMPPDLNQWGPDELAALKQGVPGGDEAREAWLQQFSGFMKYERSLKAVICVECGVAIKDLRSAELTKHEETPKHRMNAKIREQARR